MEAWKEWVELPKPEDEDLPGEWEGKCTPFQKLLLLRALRTDRVTAALTRFIVQEMGARYMSQPRSTWRTRLRTPPARRRSSLCSSPVSTRASISRTLGSKLGFTEANGKYVSISMGQGQEKNAENVLDRFTRGRRLGLPAERPPDAGWLPMLERKLEIALRSGHEDFRCFLSAEPPRCPRRARARGYHAVVHQGCQRAADGRQVEPPLALRSSSQETLDKSTKPVVAPPDAARRSASSTHSVLGRRKFGFRASRAVRVQQRRPDVCAAVLHNYLEANEQTPWPDVRYIVGEIMYGGHITDPWDRRITNTYLEVLLNPDLVDEKSRLHARARLRRCSRASYEDYRQYIEEASPPESPLLFGMHPNAEISLLNSLCDGLFFVHPLRLGRRRRRRRRRQSKEEKVSGAAEALRSCCERVQHG